MTTHEIDCRKRLLEKHSVEEKGIWQIYGEDPNCDLGGPHGMAAR
jgi:hypothetical protein